MLESVRSKAYGALSSPLGNRFLPVRLVKSAALYCNDIVGRPLATRGEFADRRELESSQRGPRDARPAAAQPRVQAPVVLFHVGRSPREVEKIERILEAAGVAFRNSDVSEDEPAFEAVRRDSRGFRFPVVFIAGEAVGGPQELANLERSGELANKLLGE